MALFGKNGLIRQKETLLAARLIAWRYKKSGIPMPDQSVVDAFAKTVVDQAHALARQNGRAVMAMIKKKVQDLSLKP